MTYNPNVHHRKSIRLKGYDYSQAGLYFITICCHQRNHLFGHIAVGANHHSPNHSPNHHSPGRSPNHSPNACNPPARMELNDAGKIAEQCWLAIPDHFPNVQLHEYIIMPNHIHGIIEIVGAKNISPPHPHRPPHPYVHHQKP